MGRVFKDMKERVRSQMRILDLRHENIIRGDSATALHFFCGVWNGKAHVSQNLADILVQMRKDNISPKIKDQTLTHILHNGLNARSNTIYENVYILGPGDVLEFDKAAPEKNPDHSCSFPYLEEKSTHTSVPSTEKLFSLLCQSLESSSAKEQKALMVSCGKDSTAIALAIKECGYEKETRAFTFGDDGEEAEIAQKTCSELGIPHKTFLMPQETTDIKAAMQHYFKHASHPSCDPTVIPYAVLVYQESIQNTHVFDGCNNSIYMGIVPSKTEERVQAYYRLQKGGFPALKMLRKFAPYYSKSNKLLMTALEFDLVYRHGHLREWETKKFYEKSHDSSAFWRDMYREQDYTREQLSFLSGHTCSYGFYFKGMTATEQLGSKCILAWNDASLISYFFNLPVEYKYDLKTHSSKKQLKKMIEEKMGPDFLNIGKRIFYFDMKNFVLSHESYIREEILNCVLWSRAIESELHKYIKLARSHKRAAAAIVDLFLISGWHNHSKYLKT